MLKMSGRRIDFRHLDSKHVREVLTLGNFKQMLPKAVPRASSLVAKACLLEPAYPTSQSTNLLVSGILGPASRRLLEPLPALCLTWHCGRFDRIPAREFDGPSADCGKPAARFSLGWLLEDVLDCDSAGRNLVFAGLFSGADREVSVHLSARRAR